LQHLPYIIWFFALGACIGSFLNVVVWRLPQVDLPVDVGLIREFILSFRALSNPPSHCPKCNNRLKWYDNIPIFGWIKLRGKCRFCKEPISMRYPIIELVTALIFVGYYVAYFILQVRSCCPNPPVHYDEFGVMQEGSRSWILSQSWPIFGLYLALLSGLLAASLIDFELFIIPLSIPWLLAILGFIVHPIFDRPEIPGSLNLIGGFGPPIAAMSAGGAIGLTISIILWNLKLLPTSFPEGEPMEVDREQFKKDLEEARRRGENVDDAELPPEYTKRQVRREIAKEMLFLLPPLILGGALMAATTWVPSLHNHWERLVLDNNWFNALLGSFLGAMAGGFVVWIVRILGTIGFGRVAMGLGDVHLMFGVGAIIGAGGATAAFFVAPVFGIALAVYRLIMRKSHEVPFGPFLALGTATVMLFYCQIEARFGPGLVGMVMILGSLLHITG
jgi:leader peptidase (prepilin peptidase)/N-methyltransferase